MRCSVSRATVTSIRPPSGEYLIALSEQVAEHVAGRVPRRRAAGGISSEVASETVSPVGMRGRLLAITFRASTAASNRSRSSRSAARVELRGEQDLLDELGEPLGLLDDDREQSLVQRRRRAEALGSTSSPRRRGSTRAACAARVRPSRRSRSASARGGAPRSGRGRRTRSRRRSACPRSRATARRTARSRRSAVATDRDVLAQLGPARDRLVGRPALQVGGVRAP